MLLERAVLEPDNIDMSAYAQFRSGLLKHIAMEEKIILPAARRLRGDEPLPVAARLRLDHGALTALLVPTPTASILAAIRAISKPIIRSRRTPAGCTINARNWEQILRRLENYSDVKVVPHVDSPFVMEATRRALARAGYDFKV